MLMARFASSRPPTDRLELLAAAGELDRPVVLSLDTTETYAFLRAVPGSSVCTYNGQQSLRGELAGFLDRFLWRYPYVHPCAVERLVEDYGVTAIAARKETVARVAAESDGGYALDRYHLVFENGSYALYTVEARPS
jgi:hypothetical protein